MASLFLFLVHYTQVNCNAYGSVQQQNARRSTYFMVVRANGRQNVICSIAHLFAQAVSAQEVRFE